MARIAVDTDDLPVGPDQQRRDVAVAIVQAQSLSHSLAQRLDLEQIRASNGALLDLGRLLVGREAQREMAGQDAGYRLGRAEAALELVTADLAAAREELALLRAEKAQASWVVAMAPVGQACTFRAIEDPLRRGGIDPATVLADRLIALGGVSLARDYAAALAADVAGRTP